MKPLGDTQRAILRSLREHGRWYDGCGWIWDNRSNTIRLLESLVQRGYATRETRTFKSPIFGVQGYTVYLPVKE